MQKQKSGVGMVGAAPPAPVFKKEQFLNSGNLKHLKDVVMAVLENGKSYTKEEAERLISSYLEKKV